MRGNGKIGDSIHREHLHIVPHIIRLNTHCNMVMDARVCKKLRNGRVDSFMVESLPLPNGRATSFIAESLLLLEAVSILNSDRLKYSHRSATPVEKSASWQQISVK